MFPCSGLCPCYGPSLWWNVWGWRWVRKIEDMAAREVACGFLLESCGWVCERCPIGLVCSPADRARSRGAYELAHTSPGLVSRLSVCRVRRWCPRVPASRCLAWSDAFGNHCKLEGLSVRFFFLKRLLSARGGFQPSAHAPFSLFWLIAPGTVGYSLSRNVIPLSLIYTDKY